MYAQIERLLIPAQQIQLYYLRYFRKLFDAVTEKRIEEGRSWRSHSEGVNACDDDFFLLLLTRVNYSGTMLALGMTITRKAPHS